jgi:hypothetical protein
MRVARSKLSQCVDAVGRRDQHRRPGDYTVASCPSQDGLTSAQARELTPRFGPKMIRRERTARRGTYARRIMAMRPRRSRFVPARSVTDPHGPSAATS